ncbi:MAG: hypothetical protein JNL74_14615 [Fibrobacteres bacterium]|nr:hypothetical protein [Fibrobacterota bacterium]
MQASEQLPIIEIHPPKKYRWKRWKILFGCFEGTEKVALIELQRQLQSYLPYVLPVIQIETQSDTDADDDNLILVGTPENNLMINEWNKTAKVPVPQEQESYAIACLPADQKNKRNTIILAGRDAVGVLYAVTDFCAQFLGRDVVRDDPSEDAGLLEKIDKQQYCEKPSITDRGIWTWGYVIYDYKDFLDNMVRLRMNMLTIWNDLPPLNIEDVINYAHERGIRIILGFHWGWGLEFDLDNDHHIQMVKEQVIDNYQTNYAHLNHDGIYFQTITETDKSTVNGVSRAKLVCSFVNRVGGALLEKHPELAIQFGVHATSILKDYADFSTLDKRISIIWEDAGVTPYSYTITDSVTQRDYENNDAWKNEVGSPDKMVAYSLKLAHLREGCGFGMVPKGFSKLRWTTEFEHHGPFILGERSKTFIERRLLERRPAWSQANALWLKYYKQAVQLYRAIIQSGQKQITATALIEDGMFEAEIPYCVALFAQILWNPFANEEEITSKSMSAYYGGQL